MYFVRRCAIIALFCLLSEELEKSVALRKMPMTYNFRFYYRESDWSKMSLRKSPHVEFHANKKRVVYVSQMNIQNDKMSLRKQKKDHFTALSPTRVVQRRELRQ